MKKAIPCAIDSGKFATKAVAELPTGVKRTSFRTKMDLTEEKFTSSNDSFVVVSNGKRVLLGKKAETVDYDTTKQKELHRIAIYTAIGQLVENGDQVRLAVGCPMNLFTDVSQREEFANFIAENKDVSILVNNNPFSFSIESITILPESAGTIFKNWDAYKDKLVGVIDIGGLNINACVYDRGDYLDSTVFTINKGANILMNELKGKLNKEFGCNLQDFQMEHIIKDGFIKKDPEKSKEFISKFLRNYVESIIKIAIQNNWDVDNMDLVFVGGGSLVLSKEIKQVMPDVEISKNAVWDNAEGFLEVVSD